MTYELLTESVTPCGGAHYAIREFSEVETDNPMDWVQANLRFPILETARNEEGDLVIITGNSAGYRVRYTFTE